MAKDKNVELEDNQHEELVPAHNEAQDGDGSRSSDRAQSGTPNAEDSPSSAGDPRDQVTRLQAERDALFDRLARQQAEFENLRKRSAKEQADFREYAVADTVKALIPILDSFDLALKAASKSNEGDLRKGVELIRKQMDEVLTRLGVQPIAAQGQPFDPRFHEAIEMVESSDVQDNHVIDELQRGYKLKERLLRPSMVRVAKHK
jgi:molecular chaperone GrpE